MRTNATAATTRRRGPGRPNAGPEGEAVKLMPRVGLRLPKATAAKLRAWSAVTQQPVWRLIDTAILDAIARLPRPQRAILEAIDKLPPANARG